MGTRGLQGQIVLPQWKHIRMYKPPALQTQIGKLNGNGGKGWECSAKQRKMRAVEVPLAKAVKGLRKLDTLIGWKVVMKDSGVDVGVVDDIFFVDASEKVRNTYLKVVEDPLGPNTNETIHLIPLVQDIVPSLVLVAKKVMLTPPDGLLDIGKSKANIAELGTELAEFTTYPCGCFGDRLGVKYMPTKRALKNAGRDDLVAAVEECGGFVVVAGELGWTTHRKPPGVWEEKGLLDQEIGLFVASCWEQFKDGNGDLFYYNKVSRRMSWEIPVLPELIPVFDDGSKIFIEDDAHRYMPTRKIVKEAGRYDLHHAIVSNGGYNTVAEDLQRRRPMKLPEFDVQERATILKSLNSFIRAQSFDILPSKEHFLSMKQPSFSQIVHELGARSITEHLSLEVPCDVSSPRRRWSSFEEVLSNFHSVIHENSFVAHDGKFRMPTHSELRSIGRADLLYQLTKFGSHNIASQLGLAPNKPGRKGCESP